MKVMAILVTMLLAASVLAVQTTSADEMLSADDIRTSNLWNGVTISWTTNMKMTGWVRYALDSPDNLDGRADDIRGASTESFTHICHLNLGEESRNRVLYYDIYGGDNMLLTSGGPLNVTIPEVQDLENPPDSLSFYGFVNNEVAPVADALVHLTVLRGAESSLTVTALTSSNGYFAENTGNGIFFEGGVLYSPAVGDIMLVEVNAGPLGRINNTNNPIVLDNEYFDDDAFDVELIPFHIGTFTLDIPFTVTNMMVSPSAGNTTTSFKFSLVYTSADPTPPSIYLVLGGQEYAMTHESGTLAEGATYSYTTTLSAGAHDFHYRIVLGDIEISTEESDSGQKTVVVEAPGDGETEPAGNTMLIIGLLVIIIVALVLAVVVKKRLT